jgi:hypothetical protein
MGIPMNPIARVATLVALLDACASSPPQPFSFPERHVGSYRYTEVVPSTSPKKTLEGRIVVERDTLTMEDNSGLCRYDMNLSSNVTIVYHCGDVTYRFDRRDPINRAAFGLTTTEYIQVIKCLDYVTNANGQRVCARTGPSTEERRAGRSGRLKPVRES